MRKSERRWERGKLVFIVPPSEIVKVREDGIIYGKR